MQTSLITGPERRRSWSEDQKLALLAAAFSPGAKVSEVARRADICTSLIYRWRRDLAAEAPSGFMRKRRFTPTFRAAI
jgi:transposase